MNVVGGMTRKMVIAELDATGGGGGCVVAGVVTCLSLVVVFLKMGEQRGRQPSVTFDS